MPPLTDPVILAQFRKVLAEWNCTGYVTAKEVVQHWITNNLLGLNLKDIAKAMHDTASAPRPFPWYCANCRRKEVRRVTIPYQCQLLHLGQPVTIVLPNFAVPKCGNCGELAIDYEADDQIHQAFAEEIDKIRRRQQSALIAPPMVRPDGQQQTLEPRSKGQ